MEKEGKKKMGKYVGKKIISSWCDCPRVFESSPHY